MITSSSNSKPDICAACGKAGENLKTCTACKLVKYCNIWCQKSHRRKHKKECRKLAAKLYDKALFEQPPPREECPICFLRLPLAHSEKFYKACCGKTLCCGCIYADSRAFCPFCRAPDSKSDREVIDRFKRRMEAQDEVATFLVGCHYAEGELGLPQDYGEAIKLWHRAGELGYATAHHSLAVAYANGDGVERDEKKEKYHYERATMGGYIRARHNLGVLEGKAGNMERAMKHWMISAGEGDYNSLAAIKMCFAQGRIAKGEFEKALRAHKDAKDEMKSDQREEAAPIFLRASRTFS